MVSMLDELLPVAPGKAAYQHSDDQVDRRIAISEFEADSSRVAAVISSLSSFFPRFGDPITILPISIPQEGFTSIRFTRHHTGEPSSTLSITSNSMPTTTPALQTSITEPSSDIYLTTPTMVVPSTAPTVYQSNTYSSSGLSSGAKIGLGVGLGVGVPLVATLVACLLIFFRRRHRRPRSPMMDQNAAHTRSDLAMVQAPQPMPITNPPPASILQTSISRKPIPPRSAYYDPPGEQLDFGAAIPDEGEGGVARREEEMRAEEAQQHQQGRSRATSLRSQLSDMISPQREELAQSISHQRSVSPVSTFSPVSPVSPTHSPPGSLRRP